MEGPLVSVIVPVYKVEAYLDECVRSILSQTYENLEVFLVDDGSPDNCGRMCDAYAERDGRVRVIHKLNGGQASARNAALDVCTGEYITFVDSDDWVKPEAVETLLTACLEARADLAICGVAFDAAYRVIEYPIREEGRVLSRRELLEEIRTGTQIRTVPWNKLYARRLFEKIRYPHGKIYEDAYVISDLLGQCQRGVLVGPCLYVQRVRLGSTTTSRFSEKDLDLLDTADRTIAYYRDNAPDLLYLAAYDRVNAITLLMRRIAEEFQYRACRELYQSLAAQLPDACARARELCPEAGEPDDMASLAMEHPVRFLWKCRTNGAVRRAKTAVKGVLARLRTAKRRSGRPGRP